MVTVAADGGANVAGAEAGADIEYDASAAMAMVVVVQYCNRSSIRLSCSGSISGSLWM